MTTETTQADRVTSRVIALDGKGSSAAAAVTGTREFVDGLVAMFERAGLQIVSRVETPADAATRTAKPRLTDGALSPTGLSAVLTRIGQQNARPLFVAPPIHDQAKEGPCGIVGHGLGCTCDMPATEV